MVMAVKYQALLCKRPQDLLLVTLNHIDEIRTFVLGDSHVSDLLDYTYSLLFSVRYSCVAVICTRLEFDACLLNSE